MGFDYVRGAKQFLDKFKNTAGEFARGGIDLGTDYLQNKANIDRLAGQWETQLMLEQGGKEMRDAEKAAMQAAILRVLQDELRAAIQDAAAGAGTMQQVGIR